MYTLKQRWWKEVERELIDDQCSWIRPKPVPKTDMQLLTTYQSILQLYFCQQANHTGRKKLKLYLCWFGKHTTQAGPQDRHATIQALLVNTIQLTVDSYRIGKNLSYICAGPQDRQATIQALLQSIGSPYREEKFETIFMLVWQKLYEVSVCDYGNKSRTQ